MPNALLIDGRAYPIRTDFRTGIEYQRIAAAGELAAAIFLSLWFPGEQPDNIPAALEGVSRFLRRKDSLPEKENSDGPTPYDLTVDSDVIAAGFQQKYGIDLTYALVAFCGTAGGPVRAELCAAGRNPDEGFKRHESQGTGAVDAPEKAIRHP